MLAVAKLKPSVECSDAFKRSVVKVFSTSPSGKKMISVSKLPFSAELLQKAFHCYLYFSRIAALNRGNWASATLSISILMIFQNLPHTHSKSFSRSEMRLSSRINLLIVGYLFAQGGLILLSMR